MDCIDEPVFLVLPVQLLPCPGETALAFVGRQPFPVVLGGLDVFGQACDVKAVVLAAFLMRQGGGEGAGAVFLQHTADFGEIGGEHGDTGVGEIGYPVGERITVVEPKILKQTEPQGGL